MKKDFFEIRIDENLSLVIPHTSCASEIFKLINEDREHLRRWLPWVDSTLTPEDTRSNLSNRIEGFQKRNQASFYGTLDGEFVASVGFISVNEVEGEIGYWLLSQHTGKGLMTNFVKACIQYGFCELNLSRIIIKCAEGNTKSRAIPEKLGFTRSTDNGSKRFRNKEEHDTVVYTLDKNDWSE